MASIINASITSTGIVQTADASGILQLQSDGVTGLTVSTGGKVVLPSTTLTTASAGTLEYNGGIPYFTPLGTQRGVIPGMQYYVLASTVVGSNVNTAQNVLGVGVTLSASTQYAFEGSVSMSKTSGAASHTVALGFGGTSTVNNISYNLSYAINTTSSSSPATSAAMNFITTNAATVFTTAQTSATLYVSYVFRGIVSVNAGGTFIPQYLLSAAPGGAYTTAIGSYMRIYPIGTAGSNVSVGTWA